MESLRERVHAMLTSRGERARESERETDRELTCVSVSAMMISSRFGVPRKVGESSPPESSSCESPWP